MGRIKGYYEWDDDNLTPGQKREGGLHQNLYDSDGSLKGSARFVPSEDEADDYAVTETVFVPVDGRRLDEEEEDLSSDIAELLSSLVAIGVMVATPHVRRWWQETAVPAIEVRRVRWREWRVQHKVRSLAAGEPNIRAVGRGLSQSQKRPRMSRAEAQARLLAALAARAYSEEQLRLVSDAEIVEGVGLAELKSSLSEIPAEQVRGVIEAMVKDPAMMREHTLAELAAVISREHPTRGSTFPEPQSQTSRSRLPAG